MLELLDPKLDVVFKLLFTREEQLLRAMLEAILGEPIVSLRVLNPELPGNLSGDKGIVLDIRVELASGKRVDVEMQSRLHAALAERFLYYGARDYADQLGHGDNYELLTPTVVIVWSVERLFPGLEEFHSVFELRERAHGWLFSDHLSIHLLELSRLGSADPGSPEEEAVVRWGRFLTAKTEHELSALATEDPIMGAAKEALERLSQDPDAARLARERAEAEKLHDVLMRMELEKKGHQAFEQGLEKGLEQGLEQGREQGRAALLASVKRHLGKRFGTLSPEAERRLATATLAELERIDEALTDELSLEEILAAGSRTS